MRADRAAIARRIVLDTNVWISAFLTRSGAPARLVRLVLETGVPVFSTATFAELETRLWRPKFDRYLSGEDRRRLLHEASSSACWADVPATITAMKFSRDADDDKLIHAAITAQAPRLITGDRDLLDVPTVEGLQIMTPAEALCLPEFQT